MTADDWKALYLVMKLAEQVCLHGHRAIRPFVEAYAVDSGAAREAGGPALNECLDMVRVALERCGLPMQGCAPMFYDDAIRQLASILGRAAGLERWVDVQRYVAEHEAERASGVGPQAPPAASGT